MARAKLPVGKPEKYFSLAFLWTGIIWFATALYFFVRYLTSPSPYTVSMLEYSLDHYNQWFQYRIWRLTLIPNTEFYIGLGIFFLFVAFVFVSGATLSLALYSLIGVLEFGFVAWALNNSGLSFFARFIFSDAVEILTYKTGAAFYLILLFIVGILAALEFKSVAKTFLVISLSLIPLPLLIYYLEQGKLEAFTQNPYVRLSWLTNYNLFVGCLAILTVSSLYLAIKHWRS